MNNGWHKVTFPDGRVMVVHVDRNSSSIGSVHNLIKDRHCLIEEVLLVTPREMERIVNEARKSGANPVS